MLITRQLIIDEVGAIVQEVTGIRGTEVTSEKSIVDDLDIDSLSMVEIGVAIEDKFGAQIAEDQLSKIVTIKDLVDCIESSTTGPYP